MGKKRVLGDLRSGPGNGTNLGHGLVIELDLAETDVGNFNLPVI